VASLNTSSSRFASYRSLFILGIVWTLLILASFVWNTFIDRHAVEEEALYLARAIHEEDIQFRHWNASNGGVYVPVSEVTRPNPYLAHVPTRDIAMPDGQLLTLVNPSYMTRQIYELKDEADLEVRGHLTSLRPLRPENAPDEWEVRALLEFQTEGATEVSSIETMEDGRQYLRMMRPMTAESECLKCHGDQGYDEGDIRGGMSVSVLMSPRIDRLHEHLAVLSVGHGLFWLLGIGGIVIAGMRQKRHEDARTRLLKQLRQSQKLESIGQLAGGVAHDFNNYLTAIRGFNDLALTELTPDSPARKDIEESRKAADRAAAMTRQLLIFSRREAIDPRPVDLNGLITDLLKMLERIIGDQFRVSCGLSEGLWAVSADAAQMEQVLVNLAVNARDAMSDGGEIRLATGNVTVDRQYAAGHPGARTGDHVRLTVEDSGAGMDAETLAHVFEPFYSTKPAGKGTGLGLAVVYGIVSQHDGWLEVESSPGQGSAFSVFLPAITDKERRDADEMDPFAGLRGHGERVLLVEDEDDVRKIAGEILTRNGYEVVAAASAEEGLELYREHKGDFRVVFSDVMLPGEGGITLVGRLLEEDPGLAVLLASGYSDAEDEEVIATKGYAFLNKPYSPGDVLKTFSRLLKG